MPPREATELFVGPRSRVRRLGRAIGEAARPDDVVALVGPLGAGKTFLARAIVHAAGVEPKVAVRSPTFTIMQHYAGRIPVIHADLYRLADATDLDALGLFEQAEGGLLVVEWADRAREAFPDQALWLELERATSLQRRVLVRGTPVEHLRSAIERAVRT